MFERRPLFIRVLMYVGESGSIRKVFFFLENVFVTAEMSYCMVLLLAQCELNSLKIRAIMWENDVTG